MVRFRDLGHLLEVLALLSLLVAAGTVGFIILEGLSLADALHLTLSTITTVGYGSPIIQTAEGRMFSNFLMAFGVGTALYGFWLLMDLSMGTHIRSALGRRSYRRELRRMQDHIILCGFGRVGQAAAERLLDSGRDFVVVSLDETELADLPEHVPRIHGDATEEDTLAEAGLEAAETLLIAFGDDSDTILTIVTARALNPKINIIARASLKENTRKMAKVGANQIIVPELVGGRRMVDHAVAPRT